MHRGRNETLKQSLETHHQELQAAHKFFMDITNKCSKEWTEITELEGRLPQLTADEQEKLAMMKHKFSLVLSADYQMGKLVPYRGLSPQPGSTKS